MFRRYLAFDIETAKVVPKDVADVLAYRPLGICCAVAAAADFQNAKIWHGGTTAGTPAACMAKSEVQALVKELGRFVDSGYTLVTWNGLGFDFNVLAEESGLPRECAQLASRQVDMMFHVVCQLGHFVGLDSVARGMELPSKVAGIQGWQVPSLWAEGTHSDVIDYNVQDVKVTLGLAVACEGGRAMRWLTRKGRLAEMPLTQGWLDVTEARQLPLPDTAWMTNPPNREEFFRWFPVAG